MLLSPCLMGNGEVILLFQTHYWDIACLPSFTFDIIGNQLELEEVAEGRLEICPFKFIVCFLSIKPLKLGEIDGVKVLTRKSGGVKFWTNLMSAGRIILIIDHFES